jgi:hypothetical protein
MTPSQIPSPKFIWQPPKRLRSGDKIWIVTDTFECYSRYYDFSDEQLWFKVGAIDLETNCIGYYVFGIDDARAMVKAGLPPPPWNQPLTSGVVLARLPHKGKQGRFPEMVSLVEIEPKLLALGSVARKTFADDGHTPNSKPGMWQKIADHFMLQTLIATTAQAMIGEFSAGDIQNIVGKDVIVSPVLKKLVLEKRLLRKGKTRGARYTVVQQTLPTRIDWCG